MASERTKIDANFKAGGVVAGVTDDASLDITMLRIDPTTKRLKVIATIDTFTGVVDGELVEATDTGSLMLGTDGTNYQILKVNADGELAINLETSDIEIGAVEIKNAASDVRALVVAATSDSDPDLDATALLGTHALLSARKDATTTVGLTAEDSTHNALHVAISDGEGIVNVDDSNNLQVILAANDGVDIGDVDVASIVPGTAATNLGKAIDSAVGATDTGIALLAKHNSDVSHLTTAEGDYDVLSLANFGGLQVAPEQHHIIDSMNVTTSWAVLGNDTTNLATTKKHILGTDALTFDKADGADGTVFAGIEKTITSVDLGGPSPHDLIQTACYLPTLTDVSYVFVRLGTDSSHYNEWRIPDTALTAATFETLLFNVGDVNYAGITGNGWNPSAVTYVVIGVAFDAETNELAGIVFDEISFHTNLHTSAELNAEVSSSVSSANINLHKIGGSTTDKGAGNVSNGSQRVVLASDQNFVHLEDVAHSTGDAGILSLAVENEDQADLSTGDKDYTPLAVTKEGNLIIKPEGTITVDGAVTANAGTNLNTSALATETSLAKLTITQGAAIGTNTLAMVGGHVTTAAPTYTTAQVNALSLATTGSLRVVDATVTTILGEVQATPTANTVLSRLKTIGDAQLADSHNVTVDNAAGSGVYIRPGTSATFPVSIASAQVAADAFAIGSIVAGAVEAGAGSFVKLEDVGSAAADAGVPAMAVRKATPADTSGADGDYEFIQMDNGRLWVSSDVSGTIAHDSPDSGNPVKIGAKAVDMGATPTAVAAADRTNLFATRGGQLFTIGGHPNTITQNLQVTDGDGAQTDAAIVTVAAGTSIVVTQISVNADNANSVDVSARIGFATTTTPAADAAGVVFFHPGIPAGGGQGIGTGAGIIGVGATNEDLRITCEDPVDGSISVQVTYYTVAIGA